MRFLVMKTSFFVMIRFLMMMMMRFLVIKMKFKQ